MGRLASLITVSINNAGISWGYKHRLCFSSLLLEKVLAIKKSLQLVSVSLWCMQLVISCPVTSWEDINQFGPDRSEFIIQVLFFFLKTLNTPTTC